jgi:hypothetical protein
MTLIRRTRWVLAAVVVAVWTPLVIVSGVVIHGWFARHSGSTTRHTLVYRVAGTVASATISYDSIDRSNHVHRVTVVARQFPWSRTFTVTGNMSGLEITASSTPAQAPGRLTCSVWGDGARDSLNGRDWRSLPALKRSEQRAGEVDVEASCSGGVGRLPDGD